jgi:hypothetical protein
MTATTTTTTTTMQKVLAAPHGGCNHLEPVVFPHDSGTPFRRGSSGGSPFNNDYNNSWMGMGKMPLRHGVVKQNTIY